ncbi:hypothetical protein TKK_0003266 [Trichogramma kaykai]|uniref:Uncharacterized protein n=1 Tax=Trichogramma kaykai TaxID=54128 RepID=A0ABD2WTF7_9HYME
MVLMTLTFMNLEADVHERDSEGRTTLIYAAQIGDLSLVHSCYLKGADINATDCTGRTALAIAANRWKDPEYEKVVQYLLLRGADANREDRDGMTPLLNAAYANYDDLCQLLIGCRADIQHKDRQGRNALVLATVRGRCECAATLLRHGCKHDYLDETGGSLLSIAARTGSLGLVRLFLDRCAATGLDPEHRDRDGRTPLHHAALKGYATICETLLARGKADVDRCDNEGKSALILAAEAGHASVVKVLLKRNACVNYEPFGGFNAFSTAMRAGHSDVARVIADHLEKLRKGRTCTFFGIRIK